MLELRALMGNRIYGCDDCLAVCPWNKFAVAATEMGYQARVGAPELAELVALGRRRVSGAVLRAARSNGLGATGLCATCFMRLAIRALLRWQRLPGVWQRTATLPLPMRRCGRWHGLGLAQVIAQGCDAVLQIRQGCQA